MNVFLSIILILTTATKSLQWKKYRPWSILEREITFCRIGVPCFLFDFTAYWIWRQWRVSTALFPGSHMGEHSRSTIRNDLKRKCSSQYWIWNQWEPSSSKCRCMDSVVWPWAVALTLVVITTNNFFPDGTFWPAVWRGRLSRVEANELPQLLIRNPPFTRCHTAYVRKATLCIKIHLITLLKIFCRIVILVMNLYLKVIGANHHLQWGQILLIIFHLRGYRSFP